MMKKIIFSSILITTLLTGCNAQIVDLNYTFNKAIIEGVGEIEVSSWCDYQDSDMVQVTAKDGTVYLTHSSKVLLIYEE